MTALIRKLLSQFHLKDQIRGNSNRTLKELNYPLYFKSFQTILDLSEKFVISREVLTFTVQEDTKADSMLLDGKEPVIGKSYFIGPDEIEFDLISNRLIPWPYDIVWLEIEGTGSGYLTWAINMPNKNFVAQYNQKLDLQTIFSSELFDQKDYTHIGYFRVEVHDNPDIAENYLVDIPHPCALINICELNRRENKNRALQVLVNSDSNYDANIQENKDTLLSEAMVILKMVCSLYSRSIEVIERVPEEKLIKRQLKNGKIPSMTYNRVALSPVVRRYIQSSGKDTGGGKLPRRLHWVRSHIRTLANGRQIPVISHLRGLGGNTDSVNRNRFYQLVSGEKDG